jgi:hypothetical protein
MSNATKRTDIAAAVSTIDGLRGFAKQPTSPNTGDAWPQWSGGERADGAMFVNSWRVYVILPSDDTTADEWADLYGDLLAEALEPVMFVEAITPARLAVTGTGDLLALMITGRSE